MLTGTLGELWQGSVSRLDAVGCWTHRGKVALVQTINCFYFIEIQLIYGVWISAVVIQLCIFFFIFFSIRVYHGTLNVVPCATRWSESESPSVVSDSATPWTLQSTGFSRPEHWSWELFPSPGDLPNPGIEPWSPTLQADSFTSWATIQWDLVYPPYIW